MTIFELLKSDHRKVSTLLNELKNTNQLDGTSRSKIFDNVKRELQVHTQAEENAVYDPLKHYSDAEELISDAIEEHSEVDQVLEEISMLDADDAEFSEKVIELCQMVEHHVNEEETEIFGKMRDLLDETVLDSMCEKMILNKEDARDKQNLYKSSGVEARH